MPCPDSRGGAKVTFKVAELPAFKIKPEDTPPMLNPAPESVTFEMETLEAPSLAKGILIGAGRRLGSGI